MAAPATISASARCRLYAGYLSNDTANASIDLVLTAGSGTLTWNGNINGNWDATTANWLAGGPAVYANGEFVQFLNGAATGTVNLTTTLTPGSVTVSNSVLNYTFNGTGSLSGSSSLQKSGSGTLVIDNSGANNFTGGVTISGGTLQVGNNDTAGSLPSWFLLILDRSPKAIIFPVRAHLRKPGPAGRCS